MAWILSACQGGGNSEEDSGIPRGVTDPAELTELAFKKQEIGAYEEAVKILNRALKFDPNFIPAHYRMGSIYEEWGQRKNAIAAYQKTLKLDPNHLDARLSLASAYGKSKKNELAILEYQKASKLKPTDPEILFKIALEYWYLQKLPETAENYRKVIALKPDYLQAHLNLASVYEHMKEWDNSLKEIAISLQLGKQTGNQQAISIAENKLLFLKGRMSLTDEEMDRRT
ncbi:MAG: tetratricopeptide repeat protein, partial [Nitrospinota bacterium]|nr:tetratricopeptide repeat protein [Nitrospinota bacterium]